MNVFIQLITSRKFIVFLLTVAGDAVSAFVTSSDTAGKLIAAITAVGAVLIGSIAHEDAAESKASGAAVKDAAQAMKDAVNAKVAAAITPSSNALGLLLFPLLALMLVAGSGCATTPTARYLQARDTLTTTQNSILKAHTAGLVSDADLIALDEFAQATRAGLKRAETQLPTGGKAFDFYMNLTEDVLGQLVTGSKLKLETGNGTGSTPRGATNRTRFDFVRPPTGGFAETEWRVHRRAGSADQGSRRSERLAMGR